MEHDIVGPRTICRARWPRGVVPRPAAAEREGADVTRKVLIIDDEDAIRFGARLALEESGYEVVEAHDGRVGLDLLRQESDSFIVLLDLMMPGMHGLNVLQEVGGDPPLAARHALILFTAARAFTAEALALYLPNRRLYELSKPFDIDHLVELVKLAEVELARVGIKS